MFHPIEPVNGSANCDQRPIHFPQSLAATAFKAATGHRKHGDVEDMVSKSPLVCQRQK